MPEVPQPLFEVTTPLGFVVRTSATYWGIIQLKHPEVRGRLSEIQGCLESPIQICRSRHDPQVYLFYTYLGRYYLCVVVKQLNGDGFIITSYVTDKIKEGERIWPTFE